MERNYYLKNTVRHQQELSKKKKGVQDKDPCKKLKALLQAKSIKIYY